MVYLLRRQGSMQATDVSLESGDAEGSAPFR